MSVDVHGRRITRLFVPPSEWVPFFHVNTSRAAYPVSQVVRTHQKGLDSGPLLYSKCHSEMGILALIVYHDVIERILRHLSL